VKAKKSVTIAAQVLTSQEIEAAATNPPPPPVTPPLPKGNQTETLQITKPLDRSSTSETEKCTSEDETDVTNIEGLTTDEDDIVTKFQRFVDKSRIEAKEELHIPYANNKEIDQMTSPVKSAIKITSLKDAASVYSEHNSRKTKINPQFYKDQNNKRPENTLNNDAIFNYEAMPIKTNIFGRPISPELAKTSSIDNELINKLTHALQSNKSNERSGFQEPRCYPPANFTLDAIDTSAPLKWKQWLMEYENYSIGSRISELKDEKRKITYFLNAAGAKVMHVYNALRSDMDNLESAINKLNNHYMPPITPSFHRMKFKNEKWLEHETVDDYVARLKEIASLGCNFSNVERDNIIKDMIIEHCHDPKLSFNLYNLLMTNTQAQLANVVMMARTHALILQQVNSKDKKLLVNKIEETKPAESVNAISSIQTFQCGRCSVKHEPGKCPARFQECKKCHKQGHFADKCFTNLERISRSSEFRSSLNRYGNYNSNRYDNRTANNNQEYDSNKNYKSKSTRNNSRATSSRKRSSSDQRKEQKDKQQRNSTSSRKSGRSSSVSSPEKERRRKHKEDKAKRKAVIQQLIQNELKQQDTFNNID